MQLMKLAYVCLICIHLKIECADVFPRMINPGRLHHLSKSLEERRIQYAKHLLTENMLKMSTSISLGEAQKLWSDMMKAIKKLTESARVSHISQYDYWLLRQG